MRLPPLPSGYGRRCKQRHGRAHSAARPQRGVAPQNHGGRGGRSDYSAEGRPCGGVARHGDGVAPWKKNTTISHCLISFINLEAVWRGEDHTSREGLKKEDGRREHTCLAEAIGD